MLTPALQDALVADDLVASLLLVHGLHPHGARTRVEAALESVRPYLGTHGGDVELMDLSDDGVVRLRLLGSCDGCPSSAATLELAVHSAIEAAAPEVTSIEVLADEPPAAGRAGRDPGLGAAGQARRRRGSPSPAAGWQRPRSGRWRSGEVGGFAVDGTDLLVCRIGADVFAFADRCAGCGSSMAGARLERFAGHPVGAGVLTCPRCRSHYDVRRAGAAVEADEAAPAAVPRARPGRRAVGRAARGGPALPEPAVAR